MKLIKQAKLHFQENNSDKVYEVDLCEVSEGQYVVNFRYGRRGSVLKDGTKTALPVKLTEAEKLYDRLVNEKRSKGYWYSEAAAAVAPVATVVAESAANLPQLPDIAAITNPQHRAILARLAIGDNPVPEKMPLIDSDASLLRQAWEFITLRETTEKNKKSTENVKMQPLWKLERAIWRAGELGLTNAEPFLLRLLGTQDDLRNYCIVWALGYCGSAAAIPPLQALYQRATQGGKLQRIAGEALLRLLPDTQRATLRQALLNRLPTKLQTAITTENQATVTTTLRELINEKETFDFNWLYTLYLIDLSITRPALLTLLREIPIKAGYFKPLRHIYKAAEYRQDAEYFGTLAYRFETSPHQLIRNYYYSLAVTEDGTFRYVNSDTIDKELASAKSKYAFSDRTRQYLQRRTWRTLRRLGEMHSPHFAPLAAQVLLAFSDDDVKPVSATPTYRRVPNSQPNRWGSYPTERITLYRDRYGHLWTFNYLLYSHSTRYAPTTIQWYCQQSYKPNDPAPNTREEAFPDLWTAQPQYLWTLLQHSRCEPVQHFALLALQDCPDFCKNLPTLELINLLNLKYLETVTFAVNHLLPRYDAQKPDLSLILGFLECTYSPAHTQAINWINANPTFFLQDTDFILRLCLNPHAEIQTYTQTLLTNPPLRAAQRETLVAKLIAHLLSLKETADEKIALFVATLLDEKFSPELAELSQPVLQDLLKHPLLSVQAIAANTLATHHANTLTTTTLHNFLDSEHILIRAAGIKLLQQWEDNKLTEHLDLIAVLSAHDREDLRLASRRLIQRLIHTNSGLLLTEHLLAALLRPRLSNEACDHLLIVLEHDCVNQFPHISTEFLWRLLRHEQTPIQQLGATLLIRRANPFELTVKQLIQMNNHPILSLRQQCWQWCHTLRQTLEADMAHAIQLLDAPWEDSREFMRDFFRQHISRDALTPTVLVSICDSVREDVQQFGRELITREFSANDTATYLSKLSEHPSPTMQAFTTHYLQTEVAGQPERLRALQPYFITVLSLINKARPAKLRIFSFLAEEAKKTEESAKIIAEILTRQTLTINKTDKATAIAILTMIQQRYPHLPLILNRLNF